MKKYFVALFITLTLLAVYFLFPGFRTISFFGTDKTELVIGGELIKEKFGPVVQNDEILLPVSIVKKYIDPTVLWDEKAQKIVFTTAEKVVKMKTDNLTAMINSKPVNLNIPATVIEKEPYLPIQFISELMKIDITWVKQSNAVIIDKRTTSIQTAEILKDKVKIRKLPSFWTPKLFAKLNAGDTLRVFEEGEKWYKVRTQEGIVGYIEKKNVKVTSLTIPQEAPTFPSQANWKPNAGKINLVWEAVYSKNPDTKKMNVINGLDVVSPTWFAITDAEGSLSNLGDIKYVEWAHKNSYKVWGLINSFDPDITHEILKNTDIREKIIQQLLIYAKLYQLDGINIDFENVYMKDKDMLTQFVRELTPLLHEQGLTVSMDVSTKSQSENWSLCFDRKALAASVDYIALMTYDQHYSKSPVAGSVAQLSWVENSLKRVLEEVPAQKLLLGVPFYMRQWKEEVVDGKLTVSSKVLTMESVQKVIAEKKPEMTWDEVSGQFYAEYKDGNATYKIWIEDEKSINLKSALVHKYNLAGVAAWRRGFENEKTWAVLQDNMKQKQSYAQWKNANIYAYKGLE